MGGMGGRENNSNYNSNNNNYYVIYNTEEDIRRNSVSYQWRQQLPVHSIICANNKVFGGIVSRYIIILITVTMTSATVRDDI